MEDGASLASMGLRLLRDRAAWTIGPAAGQLGRWCDFSEAPCASFADDDGQLARSPHTPRAGGPRAVLPVSSIQISERRFMSVTPSIHRGDEGLD
jgi:hypothetical protein